MTMTPQEKIFELHSKNMFMVSEVIKIIKELEAQLATERQNRELAEKFGCLSSEARMAMSRNCLQIMELTKRAERAEAQCNKMESDYYELEQRLKTAESLVEDLTVSSKCADCDMSGSKEMVTRMERMEDALLRITQDVGAECVLCEVNKDIAREALKEVPNGANTNGLGV